MHADIPLDKKLMKSTFILIVQIFIILTGYTDKLCSQTFDTVAIFKARQEFLDGKLVVKEWEPKDYTVVKEKTKYLKKNNFTKTIAYEYKGFTVYFDYARFIEYYDKDLNIVFKNDTNILSHNLPKSYSNKDTIHLNEYLKNRRDENHVLQYLGQLALEKKINIYQNPSLEIIKQFTIKDIVNENKHNITKVQWFYFNGVHLFGKFIMIGDKRWDD